MHDMNSDKLVTNYHANYHYSYIPDEWAHLKLLLLVLHH